MDAALALQPFPPQCICLAQPLLAEKTQALCALQTVQKDQTTHLQWFCLWTESLSTEFHDRIGTKSVSHFVLTHSKKPQSRIGLQFWGRNQNRLVSWINAVKIQDLLTRAKCPCLQMFTSYIQILLNSKCQWTLLLELYQGEQNSWVIDSANKQHYDINKKYVLPTNNWDWIITILRHLDYLTWK